MTDEHDDDLEPEVDEGDEIETERFADVEDVVADELSREVANNDSEERPSSNSSDDDASDTI